MVHEAIPKGEAKELPGKFCGRILRGKEERDFETLTDNPERRVVFFLPDDELAKVRGIQSNYGKLQEIGWTGREIDTYVREGKRIKLLEFPNETELAQPATWENLIHVVCQAYPELADKISSNIEALQVTPYAKIFEFDHELKDIPTDATKRMTLEKYAQAAGTLAETRAFLRDTLNINEQFSGDGYTYTSDGRKGVVELVGLNRKIADIPGAQITDLDIDLPESSPSNRIPEDFRNGEEGYYPDRLVGKTKRTDALQEISASLTSDLPEDKAKEVQQRLYDLVVYNAYGRVYPTPNSCSDFIGVVDPEKGKALSPLRRLKYRDCVALITVRGNLAIVGGFNDIGEAMTQTVARESREEIGAKNIKNFVFFSERSNTTRDNGIVVISSCASGLVDKEELKAGDDAGEVFIVKLGKKGQFNTDILKPGTYKDVDGKTFTHKGMRGDHGELLKTLYNFWQDKKKRSHESLASAIKRRSRMFPQEWFEGYAEHPEGLDNYEPLTDGDTSTLLTPNIIFTLSTAEKIFTDAGFEDATDRARKFVVACAQENADVLPPFPQAGVTVDCIVVRNNNLIVQKMKDGSYRLPGSFYSPEKIQAGASLAQFANETIAKRFGGIDFNAHMYLGTVGGDVALGHQADPRFPRLSHVYVGTTTGEYVKHPKDIKDLEEIVEIPIWKDDAHTELSPQITQANWGFGHNKEIIEPLLGRALNVLTEDGKGKMAEDLILQERLAS